jgi:outer membrane protein OmpA-like peptidoglycan-associated protein
MKPITYLIIIACAGLLVSCAAVPPTELINARQAYQQASQGQAAILVPAELHKAQAALAIAEKSFKDDPKSFLTRDLAYVADRKAKMAEALATTAAGNAATAKANKEYQATQTEIVKNTKEDLAASERSAALKTEQLAGAEALRVKQQTDANAEALLMKQQTEANAETQRVKESTDAEARRVKGLTDAEARRVKDLADAEARRLNTIIILEKGRKVVLKGVNFETNKATLRNESETVLTGAYNALVANPNVQVEISGHTDNVGNQKDNQVLSLKRAQSVRNWLVEKGIASNRMKTVGKGQNEPVSSNITDAGRAENRRIEFYVQQ